MPLTTVGIVDYRVGNHASVSSAIREIGYRLRISHKPEVLDSADILVLPGVGSFPAAMESISSLGLRSYLKEKVRQQKPLLGICLGMQLLATEGYELGITSGLDIIPGEVVPLDAGGCHIGWNTLEPITSDNLLAPSNGDDFYFNHSFVFKAPEEYVSAVARRDERITAVVRRGRVAGMQFHPEKSQLAGRRLLKNLIDGLCHA